MGRGSPRGRTGEPTVGAWRSRAMLLAIVPLFSLEVMLAPALGTSTDGGFRHSKNGMLLSGVTLGGMLLVLPLVALSGVRAVKGHVWSFAGCLVTGSLGVVVFGARGEAWPTAAAAMVLGAGRAGCLLFALSHLVALRGDQRVVQGLNSSLQRVAALCGVAVLTAAGVQHDRGLALSGAAVAACVCGLLFVLAAEESKVLLQEPIRASDGWRTELGAVVTMLFTNRLLLCSGILNLAIFFTLFVINAAVPRLVARAGGTETVGFALLVNPLLVREAVAIVVGCAFAVLRPAADPRQLATWAVTTFAGGFAVLAASAGTVGLVTSQVLHGVGVALAILATNLLVRDSACSAVSPETQPLLYRLAATQIPIGVGLLVSVPVIDALSRVSSGAMFGACLATTCALALLLRVLLRRKVTVDPAVLPGPRPDAAAG